jgi:trimethylamine--corrinoid protein Co-methyltransferase
LTAALIGVAGADFIGMSTAMMGSAIGASLESMVVDDEIYGTVNSAIRLIEVNDDTLSYEVIEETIKGDGHYLGHPQTLHLMRKEFYYPKLADRSSPHEWMQKGSPDYRETVRERLREIMRTHNPTYIDPKTDNLIRKNFPIRIASESMRSDSGRW